MPLWKVVNGKQVQMTPAEEAEFVASRAIPLEKWKNRLRSIVRTRRKLVEEAGTTVGQNKIETTQEFRQQLRELREWLADNPGQQVPVRLANGKVVRVNAAQLTAAGNAIRDHVRACMEAEAGHLEAVDALATVADAEQYDTSTGWPA